MSVDIFTTQIKSTYLAIMACQIASANLILNMHNSLVFFHLSWMWPYQKKYILQSSIITLQGLALESTSNTLWYTIPKWLYHTRQKWASILNSRVQGWQSIWLPGRFIFHTYIHVPRPCWQKKLCGLSPRANYNDRAPPLVDELSTNFCR
jgi:hypothetical protein